MKKENFIKIVFLTLLAIIIIIAGLLLPKAFSLNEENLMTRKLWKEIEDWSSLIIKTPLPENTDLSEEKLELKEVSTPGPLPAPQAEKGTNVLSPEKIIYWTNSTRQFQGFELLKENEVLDKIAEKRLDDMFEKQYFEHLSPEGIGVANIAQEFNYQYLKIGENLALGNFKSEEELVNAWMGSEGHRENILNPKFKEIGVAARKDIFAGKKTFIAVQVFATALSDCPLPDENIKKTIDEKEDRINALNVQIDNLKKEIEAIQQESRDLYNQGEDQIKQENYGGIPLINKKLEENNERIKTKIEEHNNLILETNNFLQEVKDLISTYNIQVEDTNQCLIQ